MAELSSQNVEGGVAEADDMFDNYRLGTELGQGGDLVGAGQID